MGKKLKNDIEQTQGGQREHRKRKENTEGNQLYKRQKELKENRKKCRERE